MFYNIRRMEQKHFYDFLIKVQSIARIGLTFSTDEYAIDNYEQLLKLSTAFLNDFQNVDLSPNGYFVKAIYPTPNISVRTVIFDEEGRVLLVQEKNDHGYSLPGGWCDLDQSASETAVKECYEEAGADVEIVRLVGIINRSPFKSPVSTREYAIVFEGRLKGNLGTHSYETSDVNFFALDKLPPFSPKVSEHENLRIIYAAKNNETIYD